MSDPKACSTCHGKAVLVKNGGWRPCPACQPPLDVNVTVDEAKALLRWTHGSPYPVNSDYPIIKGLLDKLRKATT